MKLLQYYGCRKVKQLSIAILFIPKYVVDRISISLRNLELKAFLHLMVKAYSVIICKYPFQKKIPIEKQK